MKRHLINRTLLIVTTVIALALAANAFAGWGMGWGQRHHMWGNEGYGRGGDLNEEEYKEMNTARQKYYEETETLRNEIYQKQLALESEFARDEVDTKAASRLQKDISKLRADLDQKRVEHMAEMKKINPDAGSGYGRGYGRGMGFGGGRGGGPCWR